MKMQPADRFYPDSGGTKEFSNEQGRFTIEANEERSGGIQASAEGYTEEAQAMPKAGEESAPLVFRLKPSKALEGIVVTQDGKPVAGALVAIAENTSAVMIYNGRLRNSGSR